MHNGIRWYQLSFSAPLFQVTIRKWDDLRQQWTRTADPVLPSKKSRSGRPATDSGPRRCGARYPIGRPESAIGSTRAEKSKTGLIRALISVTWRP